VPGTDKQKELADALLTVAGRTYADEAGIRLKDTPGPLYQLLVLATLLSARISSGVALAAARELFSAGMRSPKSMREASWQDRVDALGRGHYRRYDERTATMLGDGADLVLDEYRGDLRRLRDAAHGSADQLRGRLTAVPGIGPVGADIFCREAQAVWPDLRPYVDPRAVKGAERLGLPRSGKALAGLVAPERLAELVAALVRASLTKQVVDDVRAARQ
jgi:hypothetical protein